MEPRDKERAKLPTVSQVVSQEPPTTLPQLAPLPSYRETFATTKPLVMSTKPHVNFSVR